MDKEPKEPLSERVRGWLEAQGYPFEMRVSHACRDAGWTPMMGAWYADPSTGKSRPIDVFAIQAQHHIGADVQVSVAAAIEAKTIANHPWIGLMSDPVENADTATIASSPGFLGTVLLRLPSVEPARLRHILLQPRESVAHSVVAAFTARSGVQESQAYGAVQSAVAAASAMMETVGNRFVASRVPPTLLQLVLPVVVVEGPLFTYSLTSTGEPTLCEAPLFRASADSPVRPGSSTLAWVVSYGALPAFLSAVGEEARHLAQAAKARLPGLETEMRNMIASIAGAA